MIKTMAMKRLFVFLALIAAGVLAVSAAGVLKVNKVSVKRTWTVPEGEELPFEFTPCVNATIDMPEGDSPLAVAVRKWITKTLDVDQLELNTAEEIIDAMALKIMHGDSPAQTCEFTIKKVYETSKLVTFAMEGYDYFGGAHGTPYYVGVTFRKSDAKDMSERLVRSDAKLNLLLRQGLKKYFGVRSDNQLRGCLFNSDLKALTKPEHTPWVEKGGVVFQYGPYEIACFAAGLPKAEIAVKSISPYLTKEGKALLK